MKRVTLLMVATIGLSFGLIPKESLALIYGTLTGTPPTGTVTYVATSDDFEDILTEDGINSDAGTDQGYQGGYWRLEARNLSPAPIPGKTTIQIEFAETAAEAGKFGSDQFLYSGPNENRNEIAFAAVDRPAPPPRPLPQEIAPGQVRLTWTNAPGVTYDVYRSTQASGANNGSSNGRYRRIATGVISPYLDTSVPAGAGTRVWYLLIATVDSKRSGHSEERSICFLADVNCDDKIDVFDITLVAAVWGCELGDPCYEARYDLNADGEIDVFDVLLVAAHWGEQAPFDQPRAPSWFAVADETASPPRVSLTASAPQMALGETWEVELFVSGTASVHAFEFEVAYGQTLMRSSPMLQLERIAGGDFLLTGSRTFFNLGPKINPTKGTLTYGGILFGESAIGKSSGRLATLTFAALEPGVYQIALTDIKCFNADYHSMPVRLPLPITIRIQPKLPLWNAVGQNYPNPFNPETWIPYQLAEGSEVEITIYNLKGQRIRGLSLGYREARYYLDKSEAVYWDGKNELGESVSPGVYFYHLRAGNFHARRKMVIIK